ncbi:circularly permuted type 2 ATP-grasp protein [Ectothiorhodospiraceae bacterium BW-2]|nr:circularly permuted type 2 ATP-grasp protein [Ectothiorhodospiraceae bacterium BW-2]
MNERWHHYRSNGCFDELIDTQGRFRSAARQVGEYFNRLTDIELSERINAANLAIQVMGISFTLYSEDEGRSIDRAWPFDVIPRIIAASEWRQIEAGLRQRVRALNHFIDDLYHQQQIVNEGIVPRHILDSSSNFRPECVGVSPPGHIWAHICGSDLVRDDQGKVYVLEDNLRVPSGVSYMLENRHLMKRTFPELFEQHTILPVDDYPSQLYDMLCSMAPEGQERPEIVVLTPGIYNSAYFEHAYLAQQMGTELVEGRDLVVGDDDCVYMRTISGHARVDVIYRRIDDLFLDPELFHPDSVLGVPGLMRAWKAGRVTLVNAPGAGVADDKVVYAYVPDMVRYYLNEEPLIDNVPTYLCDDVEQRDYVLHHLEQLVVKPANESGGYGMLIGPHAEQAEREQFRQLINKNPRNYIAQPMLCLSTTPTVIENRFEARHIDLRPFILSGMEGSVAITTGGLTRVAMRRGSTVVNSSQGGGSKDTWIVEESE